MAISHCTGRPIRAEPTAERIGRSGRRNHRRVIRHERGTHPWTLDEATSRPFLQRALELGINFFDTANVYSDGTSEEIVGRALRDFAKRDEIVMANKATGRLDSVDGRSRRVCR